ncbi:unnamed protein product, partial [Thlaspi arvense]
RFGVPLHSPHVWTHLTSVILSFKHWRCLPPFGIKAGTSIWISRNYLIFENRIFTAQETITKALHDAREWKLAQKEEETYVSLAKQVVASPLNSDDNACNTDVDCSVDRQQAGLGWVFRTHKGAIMTQGTQIDSSAASLLMTESLAIFNALKKALHEGSHRSFKLRQAPEGDLRLGLRHQAPLSPSTLSPFSLYQDQLMG